jgi:hypothetical protein
MGTRGDSGGGGRPSPGRGGAGDLGRPRARQNGSAIVILNSAVTSCSTARGEGGGGVLGEGGGRGVALPPDPGLPRGEVGADGRIQWRRVEEAAGELSSLEVTRGEERGRRGGGGGGGSRRALRPRGRSRRPPLLPQNRAASIGDARRCRWWWVEVTVVGTEETRRRERIPGLGTRGGLPHFAASVAVSTVAVPSSF